MFDIDKWQEILGTIWKHKLRTLLTAFGVFWGIFMLVLLLAAGKGLENGVKKSFGNLAKNTMWIWTGRTTVAFEGRKPGRQINFTNDDYASLQKEFAGIQYINASKGLWGSFSVSYGKANGAFRVEGHYPVMNQINALMFTKGRYINHTDIIDRRKVAVLGPRVVEVLFGKKEHLGKYIKIKGAYFQVIGTFNTDNSGNDGREDAEKIFIPLTTMQQTFNANNKINVFAVTPKDGVDPEKLESDIKKFLSDRHDVSHEDKSAIGSWNSGTESKKINGLFSGINTFVWGVGIMTIIAGIVGISNIMLIVVKERTKEIGVRKALGATPGSIVSLILTEAIFITSIAGYLGLSAGVGLTKLVGDLLKSSGAESSYFSNPQIDFKTSIIATAILIISGALAGLFPALKASRINPIEALRAE